jgi:hypothetical protein
MRFAPLTLVVVSSSLMAWAADPFIGSWKLDMEKSSTSKGKVTEQRQSTYVNIPDGYRIINQIGSGPQGQGFDLLLDGKEREAPKTRIVANAGATTAIAKRVSANIFVIDYRRDGKTVATDRTEVSGDGKVLTMTTDGTYVDGGAKLHNVWVYIRK